ncbi:F-box domain containing protein [Trema orientale]|uniref:F-box domain containing protein n=1 Tax=Trema orientale TaxID=63057 RepID=A0A2P5E8R7_TREOI|nr:F-box domain containing protein [Trema orientale]
MDPSIRFSTKKHRTQREKRKMNITSSITNTSQTPTTHDHHHHHVGPTDHDHDHDHDDRLSDLPEPIIHHVMSFLPTKSVTRFSALSRRLSSAWHSFPIINFDSDLASSFLLAASKQTFLDFGVASVQRRRRRRLSSDCDLQRFRFRAPLGRCGDEENDDVGEIVSFALEERVKQLTLDCRPECKHGKVEPPVLPEAVFSSKSIKTMELYGLKLRSSSDEGLILVSCPLMEDLTIGECTTIPSLTDSSSTTVKVSCGKLKTLRFENCRGIQRIQVDDGAVRRTTLESFSFVSRSHDYHCEIDLSSCKSLKSLELKNVHIVSDEWFSGQVSQLVSLESLKLTSCGGLKSIVCRCNNSLKIMDLNDCWTLENIEVVSLNLEFFRYSTVSSGIISDSRVISNSRKFDIRGCVFLKNLRLIGANVTDTWVRDNINAVSGFQFLENLCLKNCNLLEKVGFCTDHLKSMKLVNCQNLLAVEISAPNLVLFTYRGHVLLSPIVVTSLILDAELSLTNSGVLGSEYFKRLRNFVSYFDHCKTLTLDCHKDDEALIFPSEEREALVSPLHDLNHLKIKLRRAELKRIVEVVDSLLWLAPRLKTLSIITSESKPLVIFKFYYKPTSFKSEEDQGDVHARCLCYSSLLKCWRHFLTRVEMDTFEDFDKKALQSFFMENAEATLSTTAQDQLP